MAVIALVRLYFFFFFQAEDGIRDLTVTGVQTCALPISGCTASGCGGHPDRAPPPPLGADPTAARAWRAGRPRRGGRAAVGRQRRRPLRGPCRTRGDADSPQAPVDRQIAWRPDHSRAAGAAAQA